MLERIKASGGQTAPAEADPLTNALNGGQPSSGSAGAVVTPPVAVCVADGVCTASPPVVAGGEAGGTPSNATLNSGNGDGANTGNGDNSSFWSSTKDKTPVESAYGHSTKYGGEFPEYQNSVQHVQAAQEFVNNPPEGTLTKARPNGDTLYYEIALKILGK